MKKVTIFSVMFLIFFFADLNYANAETVEFKKYPDKYPDVCGVSINKGVVNARGTYTYDINSVTTVNGNLIIEGWGVLNSSGGEYKINNVEPTFELTLEGYNAPDPNDLDRLGAYVGSMKFTNQNENDIQAWPSYSSAGARPKDYTEYYFSSTSCSSPYRLYGATSKRSSATDGNALCYAAVDQNNSVQRNKLYINLNFKFSIPLKDMKENFVKAGANRIYMRLSIKTADKTITVYDNPITIAERSESCIPISLQSSRISDITKAELKKYNVANVQESVSKIDIMVIKSRPRSTNVYFGNWWYKYTSARNGTRLISEAATNYPSNGRSFVYFIQRDPYDLISPAEPIPNYINQTITYVYPVGIKLQYLGGQYTEYVVDVTREEERSAAIAYVPAMWARPTLSGMGTFFKLEDDCPINLCDTDKLDLENRSKIVCPIKDKNDLENTECCKTICAIDANKETYYCTNMCKITNPTCSVNTKCDSKNDLNTNRTTCPSTKNPNTPGTSASDDCCNDICKAGSGNEGTYFCTNICKITNPSCSANTKCDSKSDLNTDRTTCPSTRNPNTPGTSASDDCCTDICKAGSGNEGTYFCTNICKTPIRTDCDTIADPQEKYCCIYNDSTLCPIYQQTDDPAAREDQCAVNRETVDDFKYPIDGYGDEQFVNDACKVSCEESIRAIFPKAITGIKAGTGFKYPIRINGDRYCTAEYLNDSWKSKIDALVVEATAAYATATTNINNAYLNDRRCGNKEGIDAGNTCSVGESLTGDGRCKRDIGFTCVARPSSNTATRRFSEICTRDGNSCNCTSTTSTRGSCKTRDRLGRCVLYNWDTTNDTSTTTACSGSYEGGSCYAYTGACPSRSSWDGSKCVKTMCSEDHSTYFDDAQVPITSSINNAYAAKAIYDSDVTKISDLMRQRITCDNYTTEVKYDGATGTKIDVDTPENDYAKQDSYTVVDQKAGEDVPISSMNNGGRVYPITVCDSTSTFNSTNSAYRDGNYPSRGDSFFVQYCNFESKPFTYYDFWNKKTIAEVNLEYSKNYSIMKYTGEPKETKDIALDSQAYVAHGRYAYTDYYAYSDTYELRNKITNIGPNINNRDKNIFSLNPFTCSYEVSNLIFPPDGDDNRVLYGSVAFSFRQISLVDPFPGRSARENWLGNEGLITRDIYTNPSQNVMEYYLDAARMQSIRIYNSTHNYGEYDISNPDKSPFLNSWVGGWR